MVDHLLDSAQAPTPVATASHPPKHRWLPGVIATIVLLGVLWLFRAPLLTAAARLVIIDEPLPEKADAIIILGGGMNHRPAEAARLHRLGLAEKVLVSYPARPGQSVAKLIPSEGELATLLLERIGVPPSSIEPLGHDATSTYDEAQAARKWAGSHPSTHLIVPTDIFHTRRVKWTFERALRGTGVRVTVTAIENNYITANTWWRSEAGLTMFQNELLKMAYYWWNYR